MCIYIYGAAFSFYFLIFKLIVKMASASHEDGSQKKGVMYVYKMDTGGSNLKPKPDQANPSAAKKAILGGGWGVGLMRRSKTVREVVVNRNDDEEERGRIEGGGDATTKTVIVEARKSASSATSDPSRKSVSHLELVNVASVAAFLQVKVLVTDMPGFMQVHAFRCARRTYDCLDTFSSKHMAYNIKKEFDKVYGPAWHCIVGSSFGSFVTHSTGGFLYFSMEKLYILVFKTKVQRAVESL